MDEMVKSVPGAGAATGLLAEFKAFAMQGNVIDMAVGIVIGAAFNAIVTSLVGDVIMPIIAMIFGQPDFSAIMLGSIKIGSFINSVVNFLIIGMSIFIVIKYALRKDTSVKSE
jgi:large conductance mechanosensitive channel